MIQPVGSVITYLAGLYAIEEKDGIHIPVFTVLTREPGESIRFIHDRMPIILPKEAVSDWCNPDSDPAKIAALALTDMFFEKVV